MTPDRIKLPSERDVAAELGGAGIFWNGIITTLEEKYGALDNTRW